MSEDSTQFLTRTLGVSVWRAPFTDSEGQTQYGKQWYCRKMVAGKSVRFPLGTNKRSAEKLAEEITSFLSIQTNTLEMALAKYNPRRAARNNHVATFTEILTNFERALNIIGRKGKPVSKSSFKGYKSFLVTMIRKVECYRAGKPFKSFFGQSNVDYSPWLDQPCDILTTRFAMDFKLASIPQDDDADEDDILTTKITADTTLRNARALFSKQAMRYYKEMGLNMPDISGFMAEPDYGAKRYFELLPPEVIVAVMRAAIELRRADADAYRAFLLCMHCGFRRAEAIAFKAHWLRQEDRPMINLVAEGSFKPKSGRGRRVVIEQWVFDQLKELGPVQEIAALDRLNDWMKKLIPEEHEVGKAVHELRKAFISFKAKTEGIHAAAAQAGHQDVKTTTQHYADAMMSDRLIPLWRKPAEEALKLA